MKSQVKSLIKRLSGIQWNFEICFRCLVLLGKISFDKIFEAVTQKFAIRCKQFWNNNLLSGLQSSQATDKNSRLLSNLVELSGTSKLVYDVWCC